MKQEDWDNLETQHEMDRIKEQKKKQEYMKSIQGQIETAFLNFCIWCRCNGYDPYEETFLKMNIYLKSDNNDYKSDDRLLFLPQTENYIENKKALKKLIIEKTKKE